MLGDCCSDKKIYVTTERGPPYNKQGRNNFDAAAYRAFLFTVGTNSGELSMRLIKRE